MEQGSDIHSSGNHCGRPKSRGYEELLKFKDKMKKSIRSYKTVMYDLDATGLKTGDVIRLTYADFDKIARHKSILGVFKQFAEDKKYVNSLWAILNKPCDMVHSEKQKFKHNLFICPLQGFLSTVKDGPFTDFLHVTGNKSAASLFQEAYGDYSRREARSKYPKPEGTSTADYSREIEGLIKVGIKKIAELLKDVMAEDAPQGILSDLKQAFRPMREIYSDLKLFGSSKEFERSVSIYKESLIRQKAIILSSDARKVSDLCLNQNDSQGVFFYEPHQKLWKKSPDLSHVIRLEEMLTLKIKPGMRDSGDLVQMLITNRVISLTENFSDRLQNIMGNYYSKIGTDDVSSLPIIQLYQKHFSKKFFSSIEEYKKTQKVRSSN